MWLFFDGECGGREAPPTSVGDGLPAARDGPYGWTNSSLLSVDCLATIVRGDLRENWPVADRRPSKLAGDQAIPLIVDGGPVIWGRRSGDFALSPTERDRPVPSQGADNSVGAMIMIWWHPSDSGGNVELGTWAKIKHMKFLVEAKIVSCGVMQPMKISNSTNSMLPFPMVNSDLARIWLKTDFSIPKHCASLAHICTQYYNEIQKTLFHTMFHLDIPTNALNH